MEKEQLVMEELLKMMSDYESIKNYILTVFDESQFTALAGKNTIDDIYVYLDTCSYTLYLRAGVARTSEMDEVICEAIGKYADTYVAKFKATCDAVLKDLNDDEQN